MGLTASSKLGEWKGEIKKKKKNLKSSWGVENLPFKNKKSTLPPNNWNSNLDVRSVFVWGEQRRKKRFLLFSSEYFNTKSFSRDCYHASRDCKCLLSSFPSIEMYIRHYREKTGARQKWNKTKNQSITHQRNDSFFPPGVQRNDVSLKQTNFLSLHAPHTRTFVHTHSHRLLVSL